MFTIFIEIKSNQNHKNVNNHENIAYLPLLGFIYTKISYYIFKKFKEIKTIKMCNNHENIAYLPFLGCT